ncbi:MAG: hypothetical protein ACI8YQ_004142, partial [Polaribacter sp.]
VHFAPLNVEFSDNLVVFDRCSHKTIADFY